MLPHPGINQDGRLDVFQERPERSHVHGYRLTRIEQGSDTGQVAREASVYALQTGAAIEHRVGEGHPAPGRRRFRVIMQQDAIAAQAVARTFKEKGP